MSTPDEGRGIKTLAIRLEPDVHAQLALIAQLKGGTIADELRLAVLHHIDAARGQADLATRADQALQEIEREAALRRDAIASLFSQGTGSSTGSEVTDLEAEATVASQSARTPRPAGRRAKGTGSASETD